MRIRELSLLRYGHLSDVVLTIPDGAGLCVVHGANEAGKSTALAAIGDALFGFGHRTAFDFKHGAPQLRVGFTLAAADGSEASFIRRKGRTGTLRDINDEIVPELALQRFLGGASRDVFDHMFGLNGDRLRVGGAALAHGGAGVGESLFAAGSGLLGLRAALAKLDEEAKSLFGDGRGKRRVLEATEAWRAAQTASEQRSVPPRAWQEAKAAHAETLAELERVQEAASLLRAEESRVQRVRRVAPLLHQLDQARATLHELAEVPHLPRDAHARLLEAIGTREQARRDSARETASATGLAAERAALTRAPILIDAQDSIDLLAEQRPVAIQAQADVSGVADEVARQRAVVLEAIADLRPGLAPEDARDMVPQAGIRRAVQLLANAHPSLLAEADAATRHRNTTIERRDQAAARLAGVPVPSDPALLRATIDRVRGEGRLDAELLRAINALAAAQAREATALAALPLWQGDAQGLAACPVPLPAESQEAAARLALAENAVTLCSAELARLSADLASCDAEFLRLDGTGPVPTQAVIAAARAERDGTWLRIRGLWERGASRTDPLSGEAEEGLPASFERLRDAADRLADQRADEAQRVADYVQATTRQLSLQQLLQKAIEKRDVAQDQQAQAALSWQALWAPTGLSPASPAAMLEWVRARADVLNLGSDVAEFARQRDEVTARCLQAKQDLANLMPGLAQEGTIASALTRADVACGALEADVKIFTAMKDALQRDVDALPALEKTVVSTRVALDDWLKTWLDAIRPLGLDSPDIAAAEAALESWSRVAEAAPAWRAGEDRLTRMRQCLDGFKEAVAGVVRLIDDEAVTPENAPSVAARLIRDLAKARAIEAEVARLASRITVHTQAAVEAGKHAADAEAAIAALRTLAGVIDDDELQSAIDNARRRDTAADENARLLITLSAQSDGLDEATLSAEAIGYHPDQAVARLLEIETETAASASRRDTLTATRVRLEAELRVMSDGLDAAGAAQDASQALAEAVAGAERYARLHMARVLLRSGIDRFRRAQQGPMLQAAGRHFATLTGGRYARLGVDESDDGRPLLVAVNANGAEIPVEALSEGTRDQLYLALRVASIEAYSAGAEPLPFIADDLLVHFDDERAASAIRLLGQLGRTTQVILFSHHDHVARLAEAEKTSDISTLRLSDYQAQPNATLV